VLCECECLAGGACGVGNVLTSGWSRKTGFSVHLESETSSIWRAESAPGLLYTHRVISVHVHTHTHTHTYIHTYIHTCTHTRRRAHTHKQLIFRLKGGGRAICTFEKVSSNSFFESLLLQCVMLCVMLCVYVHVFVRVRVRVCVHSL